MEFIEKKWILQNVPVDFRGLSEIFGLDPVVIRVLANRGYDTEEKIRAYFSDQTFVFDSGAGLPDLDRAIEALKRFRDEGKKVRIIGDYDIDGVCASTILLKGLKHFGIEADSVIPHRVLDGYGLNKDLIETAHADGVEAVVTCDNGIAAYEEVERAGELGMEVVITDHHEVPERIPNALAVTDPKRKDNTYPNQDICGAYVAYKVIANLLWGTEQTGVISVPEADTALRNELLMLAGFATVGDVMPLNAENRNLVRFTLSHLKDGLNPGMEALIRAKALEDKQITSYSIGFVLGPCINATGRIDSAMHALNLLTTNDPVEAKRLAEMLRDMNEERKDITARGQELAINTVNGYESVPDVIILYLPEIHESIVGIIAGHVRETFYRPSIVFTDTEGGIIKGSGRSIDAYDMFARLSECKDLFEKFGGHPLAAGISMKKENLETMREYLNLHSGLSKEDLKPVISVDVPMPFDYVTEEFIHQLETLEPFGSGNAKPVFARQDVIITGGRIVGKNSDVGIFTVREPGRGDSIYKLKLFRGLAEFHEYLDYSFGEGTSQALYRGKEVHLKVAYYPDLNEYLGNKSIEFVMTEYSVCMQT